MRQDCLLATEALGQNRGIWMRKKAGFVHGARVFAQNIIFAHYHPGKLRRINIEKGFMHIYIREYSN